MYRTDVIQRMKYKDIKSQIRENALKFGFPEEFPFPDFDPKFHGSHYRKDYLLKYFPDFYRFLEETYPMVGEHKVRIQLMIQGLKEPPRCPTCGKYVKMNANGKFNLHCSNICGIHDDNTKKKTHETCSNRTDEYRLELSEKKKRTCLENYGVDNPMLLEETKEKIKTTCLERYGVDHPSKTKEFQEKKKSTCLEKYGVDNPRKSEVVKEKARTTCLEKYGVDNPTKSKEVIYRRRKSNLEKYGTENPGNLPENIEKRRNTSIERYGYDNPSKSPEIKKIISESTKEKYGVEWPCQLAHKGDSGPEIEFENFLVESGLEFGKHYLKQFPISAQDFDFKIGNVLVEIDPTATHNSVFSPYNGGKPKGKMYHREKSEHANMAGYHCIHVWDWDDRRKIVRMLVNKVSIGARECKLVSVSPKDPLVNIFLDENHLQGKCSGTKLVLALERNGEIVQMMTFGKPRYNKKCQWELYRFCTKLGHVVLGGAERLFKEFVEVYRPESIVSYCDMSKFSGTVYERLGFTLEKKPQPSCHWYNLRTKQHITDNLLRQLGYDKLFNANYGKGTNNEELMLKNGFVSLWDCGQATYIWRPDTATGD